MNMSRLQKRKQDDIDITISDNEDSTMNQSQLDEIPSTFLLVSEMHDKDTQIIVSDNSRGVVHSSSITQEVEVGCWRSHYGVPLANQKLPCKHCPASISIKSGTRSAYRHLRECHTQLSRNSNAVSSQSRISLDERSVTVTQYTPERFRKSLVQFVVDTNQPFVVVEHKSFRQLLLLLRSDIVIPGADAIRNTIISSYEIGRNSLIEILQKFKGSVNCTMDLWTSPANISFMAITIHWLDESFNLMNVLLSFVEISEESHSSKVLEKHFREQLICFNLQEKVYYLQRSFNIYI